MTTWQEANRQWPRLALAGGLSAITCPFPLLLFRDWRKYGQWLETGREKKARGGKDVCMCICVEAGWRNVKVHWVQIDVKGYRGGPFEGGKCLSWMLNCTQT